MIDSESCISSDLLRIHSKMEDLREFVRRLPTYLRDDFRSLMEHWELNRTYYMFLHKLTESEGSTGDLISIYDLENIQTVNSIEIDPLVQAILHNEDFADLASEDRYGPVKDVSALTIDQVQALIDKMSQRSEILFLNFAFEVINAEIEALL